MGWFGYGPLDGDDGFDLRDELFHLIGVEYDDKDYVISSAEEISKLLDKNQDKIYDWLRDYDWTKTYNPGMVQQFWIQATMQLMLDYGVKISDRGKKGAIPFIEDDHWAKENIERAKEIQRLLREVKES